MEEDKERFWAPNALKEEESERYANLLKAACDDDGDAITELAKEGLNLDALHRQTSDDFGTTALHEAAARGNVKAMKSLIGGGATVDVSYYNRTCAEDGHTPLFSAALGSHAEAIRILLDAGADPRHENEYNCPPFAAILKRSCDVVGVKQPPKITQRQGDAIRAFVEYGYKVEDPLYEDATTVMEQLVMLADMDYVRQYLSWNASNESLLLAATQYHQKTDVLDFLVKNGLRDRDGYALWATVSWGGQPKIAKFLIEQAESLPAGASSKALGRAAIFASTEMVKLLLDKGASPNTKDDEGATPLIMACSQPHPRTENIQLLLANGADVNDAARCRGNTALHVALRICNIDVVKLLLDAGADVNQRNQAKETPLMKVAESYPRCAQSEPVLSRKWTALNMLLDAGADPSLVDDKGNTAISIMAANKREEDQDRVDEAIKLLKNALLAAPAAATSVAV